MPGSKVRSFKTISELQNAFLSDECDGWSSDISKLAALHLGYPNGREALDILPDMFSKELLGPVVRDGDSQWYDAVNWIVCAQFSQRSLALPRTTSSR
jgi:general L-amino acid transport system substrate-binding protein